ncbi:tRNA (uracil-5-)-methyltransferase [Enterococcus sp. AZ109]|uniref:tRNA (uracil-5-)-methyltransferase n=1 Tax=Enterococcus sp. AZ109 TaxID=2774634 RepID=UPI003F225B7B
MREKKKIMTIIGLFIFLGLIVIGIGFNKKTNDAVVETEGQEWTGKKNIPVKKESESIAIPGFESMTFVKDEKKQTVNLYNPEINTCYFKLSLLLPDGTQIWESKFIEPGNGIYEIELNQELAEGEYENAILKYECFSMNEQQTPLNGSEIKFNLHIV